MIGDLRACGRAIAASLFLLLWGIGHALLRPWVHGEARERWRRRLLGGGSRGVLRILSVEVEIDGDLPERAGVLVTNHLGYLDVLVLASRFDVVFVSRADVHRWPGIGALARASGTMFLDRDRKRQLPEVMGEMQAWIDSGVRVVFFPEGTSGRGDALLPFRSSLFEVVVAARAEVHAAALDYHTHPGDPPADEVVCWWGDASFLPHLWAMMRLRGIRARIAFAPGNHASNDRKAMARAAQAAVQGRFRPSTVSVNERASR